MASVHSREIFDAARDELLKYENVFDILTSGALIGARSGTVRYAD
ncbi:hypothetical protein [Microvirga guangxiensis]|nr:hypothetical protein [Microvirga guangxiensis]